MPRQSAIIRLRNRMSHALFEQKENIESGAYKILYETLQNETKDEPTEKIWVAITYAKASIEYENDSSQPNISIHCRNVCIPSTMYETAKEQLKKRHLHCSFYFIIEGRSCNELEKSRQDFAKQLDEPYLFCKEDSDYDYTLISVAPVE